MNSDTIKFSKNTTREIAKFVSVVNYLLVGNYPNVKISKYYFADAVYGLFDKIYEECIDEFEEVALINEDISNCYNDNDEITYLLKNVSIYDLNVMIEMIILFGDTHEWGCNDYAKELFADAFITLFYDKIFATQKCDEFIKYVLKGE